MSNDYNVENTTETTTPALPMKWHKFLINFSLWAGAVLCLINAFTYFTGAHYGDSVELVYAIYGGMSVLDKVMGLIELAMAVFSIITRFALAGYQAKAPKMLLLVYAINGSLTIVYAVLASAVSGLPLGDLLDSSTIGSLVACVALIFYNRDYYAKRAELFTR